MLVEYRVCLCGLKFGFDHIAVGQLKHNCNNHAGFMAGRKTSEFCQTTYDDWKDAINSLNECKLEYKTGLKWRCQARSAILVKKLWTP